MNKIEKTFYTNLLNYMGSNKDKLFISEEGLEYVYRFFKEDDYFILEIDFDTPNETITTRTLLEIQKQNGDFEFSGYIPDFTIGIDGCYSGYVIEIDSYEWHEKSREQAITDKKKDRAYLKKDFVPIRFSGLEVYHESLKCVQDMFEIIIIQEITRQRGKLEKLSMENYELSEKINSLLKMGK